MSSGPCVVIKPGRAAAMISTSGFTEPLSSAYQKLNSSAMMAMYVGPRSLRNDAGRTSMRMLFFNSIASAVRLTTSCCRIGLALEIILDVVQQLLGNTLVLGQAQEACQFPRFSEHR